MWPWESIPPKSESYDDWLYQGSHLFTALYCFYKASLWGVEILIRPNHPIYPKGFQNNFLKLLLHLQSKIFMKIWNIGEGFIEIFINNSYLRLRVDLQFMFLVYSQHKAKNFLANKFGYGCWNGGTFTKKEACFLLQAFSSLYKCEYPRYFRFFL